MDEKTPNGLPPAPPQKPAETPDPTEILQTDLEPTTPDPIDLEEAVVSTAEPAGSVLDGNQQRFKPKEMGAEMAAYLHTREEDPEKIQTIKDLFEETGRLANRLENFAPASNLSPDGKKSIREAIQLFNMNRAGIARLQTFYEALREVETEFSERGFNMKYPIDVNTRDKIRRELETREEYSDQEFLEKIYFELEDPISPEFAKKIFGETFTDALAIHDAEMDSQIQELLDFLAENHLYAAVEDQEDSEYTYNHELKEKVTLIMQTMLEGWKLSSKYLDRISEIYKRVTTDSVYPSEKKTQLMSDIPAAKREFNADMKIGAIAWAELLKQLGVQIQEVDLGRPEYREIKESFRRAFELVHIHYFFAALMKRNLMHQRNSLAGQKIGLFTINLEDDDISFDDLHDDSAHATQNILLVVVEILKVMHLEKIRKALLRIDSEEK